jgi:cytochrome P450
MLSTALRLIGERRELGDALRADAGLIPIFVEEIIRLESPIQGNFRLARRTTEVAGVPIPAGTTLMIMEGAANRDPDQFDDPATMRLDRPNGRQHVGFGFGIHSCAGAPLARAEGRVSLERILARMTDIHISDAEHGPTGDRHFEYTPIFMLRGLERLHLDFTPTGS